MKACIICNPNAGSVDDQEQIREQLVELSGTTVRFTNGAGDAARLAAEAAQEGCGTIVAAGGDGTLNEVINGVAAHAAEVQLGLLPLGTANDFARMLHLPPRLTDCIEVLRAGHTRRVDLVRLSMNGTVRHYVNVSAGGFSGCVDEKLTPELKQSWGPLAYVRCAAEALPELRAYQTEIVLDDATTIAPDLYNAVIANGRYAGGGTPVAPEAAIDDGLLDVVLVPKRPAGSLALLVAQIALGGHLENGDIIFRRAAKVSVRSTPGMWFNADGELIGNQPATFQVLPRALNFLAPPSAE